MGIPKFFRWISERYPMCSALVEENKIPVFDNMYLDMNGIIHPCSHPNDDNPHFRITEEEIFLAIFNYIDALFAKIRPKSVFFMAVDGVAPRAKMNQQRSRRFRTAKDAQDARKKALAKGEDLPKEKAFDSNCITPGTSFMARLSENLKYFIAKKISEDAAWSSITVILSGHDVPGEGEHKIMEYIRSLRASDDYRPNIRHCLYGLDADLIMLGLLSHEPHFALLREEVTFGGRNKKTLATSNPDSQNFYLMHLSIFREYLDLEFKSMDESLVGFEYSLEHIIDDFILLSFFVGNDFLPHLPGLHINEGALAEFFKIYKEKLPEMGGYINENGILNLNRLEVLLNRIGDIERDSFLAERGYTVEVPSTPQRNKSRKFRNQPKGKENISDGIFKINDRKQPIHISRKQKELYDTVRTFLMQPRGTKDSESRIFFSSHLSDMDRTFVISLCKELGLKHGVDFDPNEEVPTSLQTQKLFVSWDVNLDDESDEESNEARMRVLKRYDFAEVLEAADFDVLKEQEGKFEKELEFQSWKSDYYREKLEINSANEEELTPIVFHYIEGLQWVLLYYYRGVPSWGWFYPFHYAPKITDLRNIQRFYPIEFEKGTPFLPFYQLMGVLPSASKELIPPAFQDLMTDPGSPILEFYPLNFEQDLNGKKQDWEAVVKIPFIDEVRLVRALKARESQLTDEEISRNSLGRAQKFFKNPDPKAPTFPRASPSPKSFPDIPKCCAVQLVYDIPSDVNLRFGLLPGNVINFHPGFPTLNTIPHSATLGYHGVAVFQQETQRETMVVTLKSASSTENRSTESIALHLLNAQTVFVGWPFLNEALVVKVGDELFSYKAAGGEGAAVTYARDIQAEPLSDVNRDRFYDSVEKTEQTYSKRFGAIIGPVDVIITVRPLKGMMLTDEGAMVKDFSTSEIDVAFQTVVEGKQHEDPRYKELPPPTVANEFLIGSSVFLLGTTANYGCLADVQGYSVDGNLLNIKLLRPLNPQLELGLSKTVDIVKQADGNERYIPAFQVCKSLKISSAALSKLTSSFFVIISGTARNRHGGNEKYNFGLNMKFESKRKKVLGMTRKIGPSWEYSQSAVNLIQDYITRFPEIVSGIDASRGGDMFSDVDLFPRDSVAVRIEELKSWIKSVGVKDFEKVSLDAQALTKPIVQQIERAVDDLYNSMGSEVYLKAKKVNNVPRNFLLKPAHAPYRCGVQLFSLGDRVVNVAASGLVPLGALGTVIGFEGSKVVDVVFDFPFMSGSTLEGRCSPHRGMCVYKETLLNLSRQQPLSGTTALVSANRSRKVIPDRVPGKPLLTSEERQRELDQGMKIESRQPLLSQRRGIVTSGLDSNAHSEYDGEPQQIRSVWTDGPSTTVKLATKKPNERNEPRPSKSRNTSQVTPVQQNSSGFSSEIDQMTQNLKAILSIGPIAPGHSTESLHVQNRPGHGGNPELQQQQLHSYSSKEQIESNNAIPHQILSTMVSGAQPSKSHFVSPQHPKQRPPPNELQQLLHGNPSLSQSVIAQSSTVRVNQTRGGHHHSFRPQGSTAPAGLQRPVFVPVTGPEGGYFQPQQGMHDPTNGNSRGGRGRARGGRGRGRGQQGTQNRQDQKDH